MKVLALRTAILVLITVLDQPPERRRENGDAGSADSAGG